MAATVAAAATAQYPHNNLILHSFV